MTMQSANAPKDSEARAQRLTRSGQATSRRALLRTGAALGAGALGAALLRDGGAAHAAARASTSKRASARSSSAHLSSGDVAILRFLAALEILESDLWQQYNELGGIQGTKDNTGSEVPGGSGNTGYTAALLNLDGDMSQYIHDNTEDEFSHFKFLDAYLVAHGADPVNLDRFRTLTGSKATGAADPDHVKRLTNLMQLTVDTSYWTRYRSRTKNPDFGDTFPPAIPDLSKGQFPAIPRSDADVDTTTPSATTLSHIQAIANTAAFHFAFIEQGGSSLYPSLAQRVSNKEVLRILLSIGPTETSHFQTWHDKAGNAVTGTDPKNPNLTFPDLNANPPDHPASPTEVTEDLQTNLIMPEPTIFLSRKFPPVSIIRPTETEGAAMGAVKALTDDGLFIGQSKAFFDFLHALAEAADDAHP